MSYTERVNSKRSHGHSCDRDRFIHVSWWLMVQNSLGSMILVLYLRYLATALNDVKENEKRFVDVCEIKENVYICAESRYENVCGGNKSRYENVFDTHKSRYKNVYICINERLKTYSNCG